MDPLAVAASGMRSAELRLAASAHNVANLVTEDFRPLRADQRSLPGGGSEVQVRQEPDPRPVDWIREFVEQVHAKHQHSASARVFAVAAETRGQLVDLFA